MPHMLSNLVQLLDRARGTIRSADLRGCCAVRARIVLSSTACVIRTDRRGTRTSLRNQAWPERRNAASELRRDHAIYFGILRASCIFVPVNARLKAAEFEFIAGDCEAQAVFVHPATWKPAQEAFKTMGWSKPIIAVGFETPPDGTIPFTDLLAETAAPPEISPAKRNDVAAIIYTSGTTGRPKGAMLTHGNVLFNIESTISGHGLKTTDVHLLIVPLFHVTGLNTIMPTAMFQGAPMIVSSSIDPEEVVDDIAKYNCTTFFGVPTTFYLLANVRDLNVEKLRSLRLICYSGAPDVTLDHRPSARDFSRRPNCIIFTAHGDDVGVDGAAGQRSALARGIDRRRTARFATFDHGRPRSVPARGRIG